MVANFITEPFDGGEHLLILPAAEDMCLNHCGEAAVSKVGPSDNTVKRRGDVMQRKLFHRLAASLRWMSLQTWKTRRFY